VAGQGKWDSPEGGRDHHPRCFTMWLAGGGVKPGITYGATDDFSFNVIESPVNVRDCTRRFCICWASTISDSRTAFKDSTTN
jgi:hypothetical protein